MKTVVIFLILIILHLIYVESVYSDIKENDYLIIELDNRLENDLSDFIQYANENGYQFYRQVTGFPNIFVFKEIKNSDDGINGYGNKRSFINRKLISHNKRVVWSSKPQKLRREKRDDFFDDSYIYVTPKFLYEHATHRRLVGNRFLANKGSNSYLHKNGDNSIFFNDELWGQEWYLQDTRTHSGLPKLDLNVIPVYAQGVSGKGVRIAVLDDGLEYTHEDLLPNYDSEISWNCNNDSPDPHPNYSQKYNSHGTRCAGEIAMVANNKKCGVGIAFNSKIGGIRLLGGDVFDLVEGMALGFAFDKIDIYSSSWGPTDDGKSLERPGYLAQKAINRGIKYGRKGKGVIYVWASGNGGSRGDNCNCDGYASSIYTIAVGSASQRGEMPWYGEMCSSILTVTYSSGAYEDQMIATTDIGNSCTVRHTGTSASAPLAAGIIALGLEVNPNLTWRDVQHLIVHTAESKQLRNNKGWLKNNVGLHYNIRFGFGLMNAESFVNLSRKWINVDNQQHDFVLFHSELNNNQSLPITLKRNEYIIKFIYQNNVISYLEHVQIELNVEYTNRGALELYLESPSLTKVQLLSKRDNDKSELGFKNWLFTSVATWSENPNGLWKFYLYDNYNGNNFGKLNNITLNFYGTKSCPNIICY